MKALLFLLLGFMFVTLLQVSLTALKNAVKTGNYDRACVLCGISVIAIVVVIGWIMSYMVNTLHYKI